MLTNFFSSLLLFVVLSGSLTATLDLGHPLTPVELVDIALENNPSTRQAWWNAKRAAAALGSARSAYYPVVGLDIHVTNGRDFKFINGPDVNYTIVGADLTLSMLLFDCGVRGANLDATKSSLIAANWHTDWSLQKVLIQVLENTYTTLNLQESLQAAKISLEDATLLLDAAKQLNAAGLSSITDVYTSQAQHSQMTMEVIFERASLDIQMAKLSSSLGLSADTTFLLAPIREIPLPPKQDIAYLIDLSLQQRADLMAKQARLAESRALQKSAQLAYRPKFLFSGRGGANHAVNDKANAAQYQVRLNLEIPLFEGFDRIYQKRMAFADTKITAEELSQLELNIALEVLTYSRTLEAAQEMLPFAEDNLKNAEKAYEGTLEKYKAGKERITEVSTALRQLAAARLLFSDVRTKLLVAAANLAYATGTLTPYLETPCTKNP